jgi:hypothetical protein
MQYTKLNEHIHKSKLNLRGAAQGHRPDGKTVYNKTKPTYKHIHTTKLNLRGGA